jgi:tetratricopeptide (TPR) repeat protein
MTPSFAVNRNHRIWVAAVALFPLALAACGEGKAGRVETSDNGASTPTIVNASLDTRTGGVMTPTTSPSSVSYTDGEAAYRDGQYEDAKRIFEGYIATRPENPWGHYMLGLSSWKLGRLADAESAFERAITLDSTHVKSYLNSSRVLLDLGRNHEALERAQKALALDSSSVDARRLVARAHHGLGQADAAIQAYRDALLADERDVWSMNNLGVLYLDKGEAELALAPLARAVQLRATAPVFQNNLGLALERTGHIGAARRAFEAALRADSTYAKASVSLARVTALVADSADIVDIDELAQLFRLQLGMWRDNASTAGAEGQVDSIPSPDSTAGRTEDESR